MRAWLSSPAVVFLEFLTTIISLGQFVLAAGKWTAKQLHAEDARSRACVAFVVVGLAALTAIAPLTWSTVIAVAEKSGQTHGEAVLYPMMIYGTSFAGLITLLDWTARRRAGRPWRSVVLLILGFGGTAGICAMSGVSLWETSLVASIPTVGMLLPVLALPPLLARSKTYSAADPGGLATRS